MPKEGRLHLIKYAPPPSRLPIYRRVDPARAVFFGKTNYEAALEEKKFIFGILRKDRSRHMTILGKSGSGKSKLCELLMRQDIMYGHGLCFFDPVGDTINRVLDFIPEERIEDVIVVDPLDTEFPIAFNPFASVPHELQYQVAQGFVEVLSRQSTNFWNAQIEHVFRFAILALLEYPKATLQSMVKIFTSEEYRKEVALHIRNERVRDFLLHEFSAISYETLSPLISRLSQFSVNPFLQHVFAEKYNKINFADMIRSRKIVLINCAKGRLGESDASFFAGIFLVKLRESMMQQQSTSDAGFYVYVDDASLFAADSFEHMLTEARGCGIGFILAMQYMEQISRRLWPSVIGNVGTLISFRLSGEDAPRIEKEMAPIFQSKDFLNLGVKEFYIKMTIDGETYDPFSAESLKVLLPKHSSLKKEIIQYSRGLYSNAGQV